MERMMISMSNLLGFLSFACFIVNEINGFQRFAEQPKYTEVNPGQDAFLTCKIIDKRGTCSWQKDNKPVGIYPKKYEWSGSSMTIHQSLQPPHLGGDCSLWIRSATLDFDDGLWECQVTASDFTTQDALTSQPVRLVVRVAPQRPRLEHEGVHVPPGHNVTVDSGAVATVKCISHYGNPPALLKWFLGEQEISPLHPQTNATEPDNPRTWSAASVVQVPANRERHGEMLKCLALHESYAAKSVAVEARMDIKYAPTIRLIGAPQIDLEEGKDVLILRCEADANPPASIVWRRAGRSEIASLQESLQLRPVGRRDAGLYTCQAQNSVGSSEQLSIQLDVKYPPRILSAGPDRLTTAPLFSPAAFECVAEGNPQPTYKWVQRISQGSAFLERGRESRLVIDNVTYDYQGDYECRATNFINGQDRTVTSEPVSLQVVGAPQVLRLNPAMHSVSVKKGESASLSLVVCADPRPRHVAWEWGSLRLEAGAGIGRYRVDEVTQDAREDCYLATLHINDADIQDARPYYLVVENERGTDRHAIHLSVEEPLEMSYLLGIAGGCLAALLILICLCIYAIRAKKCCFKGRSGYKSSDKDSEKADLKSRSDSTSGPQGDSIYTTPAGFHHHHHNSGQGSPEAMKSTTLQNGLIWKNELLSHAGGGTFMYKPTKGSNADLVLGSQRHHRDLFTGDLGIPEITTRVGSVIHAFETMAMLRRNAEKPYDDIDSKYSTSGKRKSTRSSRSNTHNGTSKYSQMKKKSIESRHKIALATSQSSSNLPVSLSNTLRSEKLHHSYNTSLAGLGLGFGDNQLDNVNGNVQPIDSRIRRQQQHPNENEFGTLVNHLIDDDDDNDACGRGDGDGDGGSTLNIGDDYRKNLFGTQPTRKRRSKTLLLGVNKHHSTKSIDTGEDIINKAFNGIWDEDDDKNYGRNDNNKNNNNNNNNNSAISRQGFLQQPKRSATLNDIFEFTNKNKNKQQKNKYKNQSISKYPSSSTMILSSDKGKYDFNYNNKPSSQRSQKDEKLQDRHLKHHQYHHYYPHQKQKQQQPEHSYSDDNENFVRGTTVSQSFIKNVKSAGNHSKVRDENFLVSSNGNNQKQQQQSGSGTNQQKRSKSSSEIVDELQRKYFQESLLTDDGGGFRSSKKSSSAASFKPRTIDRAEI